MVHDLELERQKYWVFRVGKDGMKSSSSLFEEKQKNFIEETTHYYFEKNGVPSKLAALAKAKKKK